MRYVFKKRKLFLAFIALVVTIILVHSDMNARGTNDFIEKKNILRVLHEETTENFTSTAIVDCDYHNIIYDDATLPKIITDDNLNYGHRIKIGGEFAPHECNAKFSTAIIVPYRDKAELLRSFLVHMHSFLHHQHIHYRIYVVEQVDSRQFNRAKLINIGAVAAIKAGYPCLILHDIDLLPLNPANIYACTKQPRHMSSKINNFRFILHYSKQFGGALAIMTKHFISINGMSNKYFGWDGGDDDLFARLESLKFTLCRFEPGISKYQKMCLIGHKENGIQQKKSCYLQNREWLKMD